MGYIPVKRSRESKVCDNNKHGDGGEGCVKKEEEAAALVK